MSQAPVGRCRKTARRDYCFSMRKWQQVMVSFLSDEWRDIEIADCIRLALIGRERTGWFWGSPSRSGRVPGGNLSLI
jgi:hypothetical protein